MALTDKQTKFLEVLFEEADGDFKTAKKLAGYNNTNMDWFTEELRLAVIEKATHYLSMNSPKAVMQMIDVMNNPTEMGQEKRLAAAKEILDRSGLTKIERVQVNSDKPIGIFILPPKDETTV